MEDLVIILITLLLGCVAFIVAAFIMKVDKIAKKFITSPTSWQELIKNAKLNKLQFMVIKISKQSLDKNACS